MSIAEERQSTRWHSKRIRCWRRRSINMRIKQRSNRQPHMQRQHRHSASPSCSDQSWARAVRPARLQTVSTHPRTPLPRLPSTRADLGLLLLPLQSRVAFNRPALLQTRLSMLLLQPHSVCARKAVPLTRSLLRLSKAAVARRPLLERSRVGDMTLLSLWLLRLRCMHRTHATRMAAARMETREVAEEQLEGRLHASGAKMWHSRRCRMLLTLMHTQPPPRPLLLLLLKLLRTRPPKPLHLPSHKHLRPRTPSHCWAMQCRRPLHLLRLLLLHFLLPLMPLTQLLLR